MDSVLKLPSDWPTAVEEQRNFVASTEDDTTNHGSRVTGVLQSFSPESTFNLYRVIAADETFRPSNYLEALAAARSDYVDIINSSAGIHHRDCKGRCRICEAVREVVEDGIHVVAGAGNALTSDRDVFCPAKIPETVSVGTYEVVCGSEVDTPPNAPPGFSRDIAPPGSYTIPTSNSPTADWVPDKNYCGGVGCSAMEDCDVNRREQLWAGNPQQNSGPIDVFAPGTVVVGNEEQIEMAIGSSYSTAVVSGSLAHVFGALHQTQPIPDPDDVTTAISGLRQTVGSSVQRKLDVTELKNTLQRH